MQSPEESAGPPINPIDSQPPALNVSLAQLLNHVEDLDNAIAAAALDPAALVGAIRDKVDGIRAVEQHLKARSEFFAAEAELLREKAGVLGKARKRLLEYCTQEMSAHRYERLPGTMWRMQLTPNPAALEFDRDPTPQDFSEFPELVRMVPRSYCWDHDNVRSALDAGKELKFARLTRGSHVRFYLNKEEKLKTPRAKAKKEVSA